MKALPLFFIFCLMVSLTNVQAENPRFYLQLSGNNDEAKTYLPYFESKVVAALQDNFGCAVVNTSLKVKELLDLEYQKQMIGNANEWSAEDLQDLSEDQKKLLGRSKEGAVEEIGKLLNHEYLIGLELKMYGTQLLISAFCLSSKSKKLQTLSRASAATEKGSGVNSTIAKVSEQLIDGLKQYEICPFTGKVDVNVSSYRDTITKEEYSVYCNYEDKIYSKVTKIKKNTESTWSLERKGIPWTDGTMNFNQVEEMNIEEMNGCYRCPSGREGGRNYHFNSYYKVNGSGISHQSIRDGKPQDDTRVELKFNDDGSYYIHIKGTSLPAGSDERINISAVGTCDNLGPESKINQKEVTIPLNVLFGPYKGDTSDKVLKQHDEVKTFDPINGEHSTIILDFELRHD